MNFISFFVFHRVRGQACVFHDEPSSELETSKDLYQQAGDHSPGSAGVWVLPQNLLGWWGSTQDLCGLLGWARAVLQSAPPTVHQGPLQRHICLPHLTNMVIVATIDNLIHLIYPL